MQRMRVGAIDIGSNSIRLLVADVDGRGEGPGSVETVARAGEICRLGRGIGRSGAIVEDLAQRAGGLAAEFVRRARALGARHIVLGATAAIRNAANGMEVAEIIERRAGLPVRVLSGDQEARLVYRSVVLGLGAKASRSACIVFDIGGGSTEVVSGVGAGAGRWTSLPFGAVSLTEAFLHTNPPADLEVAALRDEVRREVMHGCASMPERVALLAGVGGTVTVLAALDRGIEAYDPSLLEGRSVGRDRLIELVARIVGAPHEERMGWPIIGEGRADIVAAGALAVEILVERFPSAGLVCSTQGLRYGLVRIAAEELRAAAEARD